MGAVENPWETYADRYDDWVARREAGLVPGAGMDALLASLLDGLGDLAGRASLDAGCGSGFLARVGSPARSTGRNRGRPGRFPRRR